MQADGCAEQTEDFPFEVLAFTGAERLQDSLARKPVQILLIAQGFFGKR